MSLEFLGVAAISTARKTPTRFGRFELWHCPGTLTVDGTPVSISRRAIELLELLVERRGEIVTKNEILTRVWPGLFVDEANLHVQVSALRKAFGPDRGMVRTIPGRGYMFAAEIESDEPAAVGDALSGLTPRRPDIATNLPRPAGPLFGRARDLAQIEALTSRSRLLTVVGMGGVGKTRLLIELGWRLASRYPDGIWLVDLAPLSAAVEVASAAAAVLGAYVPAPEEAVEAVVTAIGRRQLLLILDNCEHLVGAAAELIQALLRALPQQSILAGSQVRLRVHEETVHSLGPLDMPPTEAADVAGYGAVELFIDRAQLSDRQFRPDAGNAAAIAEICRGLEGIPLALQMAAARVPLLGLEGLRRGLGERLRMLKFASTDGEVRHRTLRAMVDWSHSLLDETERRLFRRLAIFAGSFTLDAATAVAGGQADRWETIDVLSQLIDKSLVVTDDGDPPRYRLLETLRLQAHEQLEIEGETAAIAERHARYFTALMSEGNILWLKIPSAAWLPLYRSEFDNVRVALTWAFERPERAQIAVDLTGSAAPMWNALDQIGAGKQYLASADALIDDSTPLPVVARLRLHHAMIQREANRQHALMLVEKAAALFRQLEDPLGLTCSLTQNGILLCNLGRFDEARAVLLEGYELALASQLDKARIAITHVLGMLAAMTGQPIEARRWYAEALVLAREAGDEVREIDVLQELTEIDLVLGEVESAIARSHQLAAKSRSIKYKGNLLHNSLLTLAAAFIIQGDLVAARAAAQESFELVADRSGHFLMICFERWALIGALEGHYRNAAELKGYIDPYYAARGHVRQPVDQMFDERLRELLIANLSAADLGACATEGSQWTEDQAKRVTIERFIG